MRLVIQRVRKAAVRVDGRDVAAIGPGLAVLVGFAAGDLPGPALEHMAERLLGLRVFDDDQGRLNRSVREVAGEVLLIPQVTLTATLAKGTRPSFDTAAPAAKARELFGLLVQHVRARHGKVAEGVFQAHMVVNLENEGPVTLVLDG